MRQPFDDMAWLKNTELPSDDEDYEWCAHFIVLADSAEAAAPWADKIVRELCSASYDVFLRSSVEPHLCPMTITAEKSIPARTFPR